MSTALNRRAWLRLGAGALLGLGMWPGCARWKDNGLGGSFRFAVVNDTHFCSAKCPGWFDRVRSSLWSHKPRPEFCLAVGDLAEHGTPAELAAMRDILRSFGMPYHVVIGNHDYSGESERSAWDMFFPRQLNYWFEHRGWQWVGLDSSQGTLWQNTSIQPATLQWLDAELPRLNPAAPTVLFTHFPLGGGVKMRPVNADDLLLRFREFNLAAVYNGHFHGFTERSFGGAMVTTNRCCAISRENHDGTPEKGYFLCDAASGRIQRQFIEVRA